MTADKQQTATLAGGCFWCLEAVFSEIEGVLRVVSGYTGGTTAQPSYEQVCTGKTGHAEAIEVVFDPKAISYQDILEIFFSVHDPTTLNRQGADIGTQYRSAIFYHNEEQKAMAQEVMARLNADHVWPKPIVTQVVACDRFYPAEEYHQGYFRKHPEQGYCQAVISPKMAKFRRKWAERLKRS